MRKLYFIVSIILSIHSCGQSQGTISSTTLSINDTFDVMLDSTSSWQQVVEATSSLIDSLSLIADDQTSLRNRMAAQQWGYMAIELLEERYSEIKESGKEVNYDDIPPLFDRIYDVLNVWFFENDEQVPHIWRDLFYVCHQRSENPIYGYFHIMVTLPNDLLPESTLQVFFPESAEDDPILVFSKYIEDQGVQEDSEQRDIVRPFNWSKKNEREEGSPMYAEFGADVVEKMLSNDVLYIMFRSSTSPNGDPAETEIARMDLSQFKNKWKESSQ